MNHIHKVNLIDSEENEGIANSNVIDTENTEKANGNTSTVWLYFSKIRQISQAYQRYS